MRRRNFLQWIVTSTAVFAAGAIPFALNRLLAPAEHRLSRRHLKPPGALKSDAEFISACIGCGLCGEVCPPRCIQFHQRDGGAQVNTPYINPEQKACTLCGKCTEVCPTNALSPIAREKVDMGIAQIDRSACYPWVDRGICGACVSICPLGEEGINFKQWNQYQPVIQSGCVGCGLCVEVCPHPSLPIRIVERSQGRVMRHTVS
ncbi:MAG: 4Fe-4S dicluster domain-containing protein [Gammaproteobacteria bacterium]|nr:4Fe-4S dicluster domain-containing protein [Gammaproteobacteria bacterium]MBQ0838548.1 4Fe-4S dicluster domain-containing protein [Gammaproteobacteria bacterium]